MSLESEGIKTIEQNGAPAKTRFSDPEALKIVYDRLTDEDAPNAKRRAKIQRVYDGNPPENPAALANTARRHTANVNWMGLKGLIDNRADVILRMASDTADIIELRPVARELAGPELYRAAKIISNEWSTMARDSGYIIPTFMRMQTQSDLFGLGPVTWKDDESYRPVALDRAQVRFVSDGPVQSSQHDLFMFESTLPASTVFFLLDEPDVAQAAGWDVPTLKKWAISVFRDDVDTSAQPGTDAGLSVVETQLAYIRQNRFMETNQFRQLKVVHAYVREMAAPRGITHIISPAGSVVNSDKKFLYRKMNAFRTMDECFLWFPYASNYRNAGDVRGLASYILAIDMMENRYKNRVADMVMQYASLYFTQQSAGSQSVISLNEQGPYTIIPKELQPVQNNIKPDMNQVLGVQQFFDQVGVNSVTGSAHGPLGTSAPLLAKGSSNQSKAELEIQQHIRSNKEVGLFNQRLSVMDKVLRESYRRSMLIVARILSGDPWYAAEYPEIVDFIARVTHRGVTPETIMASYQTCLVVTCRDLVLGSEGKAGILASLMQGFGGNMDEPSRRNATRDWVELNLGTQSADRYAPEMSRDQAPSDQASLATLENGMMKAGQQVLMGPDQWHWSHIPVHSQVLQEIVQQVAAPEDNNPDVDTFGNEKTDLSVAEQTLQNVQDPKSMQRLLATCSQHIQEHLSVGAQQIGMEQQAEQVKKMLRDLRPTIKALNLAVATQERVEQAQREKAEREQQALQQAADQNELEKAKYEIDKKAEIEQYRVDKEHEVAMRKAGLDEQAAAAADAREERRLAGSESRLERETDSRIDAQNKMAQARVNAANAVSHMNSVNEVIGTDHVAPADLMAQPQYGGEEAYAGL